MENLIVCVSLIQALDALRLNLTHFYLLKTSWSGNYKACSSIHQQTLERKGWIVDGVLTKSGKLLYEQLSTKVDSEDTEGLPAVVEEIKKTLAEGKEKDKEAFERFWSAYPATSSWYDDNGRKIDGGRSLRQPGKSKMEKVFFDCLREVRAKGKDVEDIIAAVEYEVAQKKRESKITGENKMAFFKMVGSYLNQRAYEAAWEAMEYDQQKRPLTTGRKLPVDTKDLF